jgi:hypothetical protein
MTGELSRRLARWKCNGGEDASYLQLDEKTPEASLHPGIDHAFLLRRIDGRGWNLDFGLGGLVSEIPFCQNACSNLFGKNEERQYLVGSFSGALSSQKVTEEFIKVG